MIQKIDTSLLSDHMMQQLLLKTNQLIAAEHSKKEEAAKCMRRNLENTLKLLPKEILNLKAGVFVKDFGGDVNVAMAKLIGNKNVINLAEEKQIFKSPQRYSEKVELKKFMKPKKRVSDRPV